MSARRFWTLVIAVSALAGCGEKQERGSAATTDAAVSTTPAAPAPARTPESSATPEPTSRGADRAYADLLLEHLRRGIRLAGIGQRQSSDRAVRRIASDVGAGERRQFKQLRALRPALPRSGGGLSVDAGDLPRADTGRVLRLRPFELAFLNEMITHHEVGLGIARSAAADARDPRLRSLARRVVSRHEKELDRMKRHRTRAFAGTEVTARPGPPGTPDGGPRDMPGAEGKRDEQREER